MEVYCKKCEITWEVSAHSYKNAKKTGCPVCKKKAISEAQSEKITSAETKRKIGKKASQRPGSLAGKTGDQHPRYKGEKARDLANPSNADYAWKNVVREYCNYTCVVSLERAINKRAPGFACHHLNGFDSYPDQRYLVTNGVYLKREIHNQFHTLKGFGKTPNNSLLIFAKKFMALIGLKEKTC